MEMLFIGVILGIVVFYLLVGLGLSVTITVMSFTKYEGYYGYNVSWYRHLFYILTTTFTWIALWWFIVDAKIEHRLKNEDRYK